VIKLIARETLMKEREERLKVFLVQIVIVSFLFIQQLMH